MREADERSEATDGARGPAVRCEELVVRYGEVVAVDQLTFAAHRGEVVALLGPNGAGKTSTVECLEGYRPPAGGRATVLGVDPRRRRAEVVTRVGVMLQRGGVYPMLGPRRLLHLFAGYYEDALPPDELLEQVGLSEVARTPWRRLSGGEQQRLSLALALVGRPEVLFLDEPTAGVDPEGRLVVRGLVDAQRRRGACVVLTSHELVEAERLADRVVVIGHGAKLAEGTPAELTAAPGVHALRFRAEAGLDLQGIAGAVGIGTLVAEVSPGSYRVDLPESLSAADGAARVTAWLAAEGRTLSDLRTGRSLEEAYLELTRAPRPGRGTHADAAVVSPSSSARGTASPEPLPAAAAATSDSSPPGTTRSPDRGRRRSLLGGRPLRVQLGAEMYMLCSNGESLLLTLGIPVAFLLFFSTVHVLPVGNGPPVDFLVPGILALAVMATAMTALGIGTGFDRGFGVLKRLAATPLGRPRLLSAKTLTVVTVELVQAVIVLAVGVGLGWRPGGGSGAVPAGAGAALVLGTIAFCGLGLLAAGTLRPLVNLAVLNMVFVVLLLLGGMLVPLSKLPGWLADLSRALPASALSDALHRTLGAGVPVSGRDWLVLAVWAVAAPVAASALFRWE